MDIFWRWFNLAFYVLNLALFLVAVFNEDTNSLILHGVVVLMLGQTMRDEREEHTCQTTTT